MKDSLRRAYDRILAGAGAKGRYEITYQEARSTLESALEELSRLREEQKEWVCVTCRVVFDRQGNCPTCGVELVVHALAVRKAMEATILKLRERVDFLEEVARESLGFSPPSL